jgi:hypothetical protein
MSNIAPLIFSQFPRFVRENYPVFMQFLQDYYEYMEQHYNSPQTILQNIRDYADIDNTNDAFLIKFQNAYPDGIPQIIATDRRLLAKAMIQFYQTKGSITSFNLLFQMVYGIPIEIHYPKTQMLRISDGKWNQNSSIRITVLTGNIASIIGRIISVKNSTGSVTAIVNSYTLISGSLYELFIGNIQHGTTFLVNDIIKANGTNFTATVNSTIIGYTILNGGLGFKLGQIFNITTANGSGSSFKVTKIGTGGTIQQLAPVSFGYGYLTNFYANVYPYFNSIGTVSSWNDYTSGFKEDGTIKNSSGKVIQTFTNNTTSPIGTNFDTVTPATIIMNLGAVANYQGYYSATDGFVSDVNVLQDGFLYQDFSYLIKSSLPVNQYRETVQKMAHPAGTKMFGEYQITNDIDLAVSVTIEEDINDQNIFSDTSFQSDSVTFSTTKVLSDTSINSDTGTVTLVNYVDLTYVDLTYTGTVTTFSY